MKALQIEINKKEYTLGFFTRKDAKRAEKKGLKVSKLDEELLTQTDKLFYTALLAKHPDITEQEAENLIEKFIDEGGELKDIIGFLAEQIVNFIQSPNGKKTKKAVKIIEL